MLKDTMEVDNRTEEYCRYAFMCEKAQNHLPKIPFIAGDFYGVNTGAAHIANVIFVLGDQEDAPYENQNPYRVWRMDQLVDLAVAKGLKVGDLFKDAEADMGKLGDEYPSILEEHVLNVIMNQCFGMQWNGEEWEPRWDQPSEVNTLKNMIEGGDSIIEAYEKVNLDMMRKEGHEIMANSIAHVLELVGEINRHAGVS